MPERTFGEDSLAMSTGWRWSDYHACYVRIIFPIKNDHWTVEVATPRCLPRDRPEKQLWCLPWRDDPSILGRVEVLKDIGSGKRKVTGYERFVVDENGKTVNGE